MGNAPHDRLRTHLQTGEQIHSRRWQEMLGYEAGEIADANHELVRRVHPNATNHTLCKAIVAMGPCRKRRDLLRKPLWPVLASRVGWSPPTDWYTVRDFFDSAEEGI